MTQSLTEALTEVAQAAVKAGDWERDQEAWNLPRGSVATASYETEDARLERANGASTRARSVEAWEDEGGASH